MKSASPKGRSDYSEKEWYILLPGHQKGPFTANKIIDLYHTKKIEKKIGLWKEGLSSWKFVEGQKELESFLKSHTDHNPTVKKNKTPVTQKSIYKTPPNRLRITYFLKKNILFTLIFFSKIKRLLVSSSAYQKAFVKSLIWKKKYTKKIKLSLITLQVIILATLSIIFFQQQKKDKLLPIKYQKGLKKIISNSQSNKIVFSLNFTKSRNKLVILTNSPKEYKVHLTFESIDQRVLSEKKIIFFASTNIKNHTAQINSFYIIQGKKIRPGEYNVSMKVDTIKNPIKTVLLYGPNKKEFEEKLSKFHKRLLAKNINNKNEVLERFTTLQSLLEHLATLFSQEVSKISTGQEINKFADIYMQQISMILHGVSLDHKHIRNKLNISEKFLHQYYQRLTKLGREIGLHIADTVDSIKKKDEISKELRNELIKNFSKNIELIQKQVIKNIQSLSSNHKN